MGIPPLITAVDNLRCVYCWAANFSSVITSISFIVVNRVWQYARRRRMLLTKWCVGYRLIIFLRVSDVNKVSSRFEYFLLIFAPELVLDVYLVVSGAKLNSASNDNIFDRSHLTKSRSLGGKWGQNSSIFAQTSTFSQMTPIKIVRFDAEFNFAPDTSN